LKEGICEGLPDSRLENRIAGAVAMPERRPLIAQVPVD
jgi:hypothetical protein